MIHKPCFCDYNAETSYCQDIFKSRTKGLSASERSEIVLIEILALRKFLIGKIALFGEIVTSVPAKYKQDGTIEEIKMIKQYQHLFIRC